MNRNKELIGKDLVVEEEYSIYRSIIWISTTQARNKVVSELDTNTANIISNTEITVRSRVKKIGWNIIHR